MQVQAVPETLTVNKLSFFLLRLFCTIHQFQMVTHNEADKTPISFLWYIFRIHFCNSNLSHSVL